MWTWQKDSFINPGKIVAAKQTALCSLIAYNKYKPSPYTWKLVVPLQNFRNILATIHSLYLIDILNISMKLCFYHLIIYSYQNHQRFLISGFSEQLKKTNQTNKKSKHKQTNKMPKEFWSWAGFIISMINFPFEKWNLFSESSEQVIIMFPTCLSNL